MGFLNPLFLVAGLAVAVPLFLHLFRRHRSRRVAFPALRYLLRTEKEHARRIRFRQLLLLLARVAVLLLLALAGARLFVAGDGGAHEPTALAVVVDNSMSSGRVAGGRRVLDGLLELAERTLALADPADRVWVLRAGEPGEVAVPGGPAAALERIRGTTPSDAGSDLPGAVARARELVAAAGLPAAEVHVLSDLQATAFPDPERDGGPGAPARGATSPGTSAAEVPVPDVPVLVYAPRRAPGSAEGEADGPGGTARNHALVSALVGGGLPPLAGRRTEVAVEVWSEGGGDPVPSLPLRLVVGDRIRAAAAGRPGATTVLPVGPFPEGRVTGWVETDPDDLRADDRRWFAATVRPPPRAAVRGEPPPFLSEALDVLAEAGRVSLASGAPAADVVIAPSGEGLEALGRGALVVVIPPADPALLPALDRRLAAAGVPWRYQTVDGGGEARVGVDRTPAHLEGLAVRRHYGLRRLGEPSPSDDVPARLETGEPWIVTGRAGEGTYRLLGSPLDADAGELPVSASMVPLLEWLLTPPGTARTPGAGGGLRAGDVLALPSAATHVETPAGTRLPVNGTHLFRRTGNAGLYTVLAGDDVLDVVAVNPPPEESRLDRLAAPELEARLGAVEAVPDSAAWIRAVFSSRRGPELWRPLLAAALALLLLEGWMASAGRATDGAGPTGPGPAAPGSSTRRRNPAPRHARSAPPA